MNALFLNLFGLFILGMAMTCTATLNRIAGGGFVPGPDDGSGKWLLSEYLPGRAIYWVTLWIGAIAWVWNPWPIALALAAAYLLWRLPPWGRWLGMGHWPPMRQPGRFEASVERIAGNKSPKTAMFIRMLFVVPGLMLVFYLTHGFQLTDIFNAFAATFWLWLAYVIGWGLEPLDGVPTAELICGAIWGLIIIGVSS